MRESRESIEARLNRQIGCNYPGCKRLADWQPFIQIPPIEGIDKTPPVAEIEFVMCEHHMLNTDPAQFLSSPVRNAIESNLIRWCGRPIVAPVDWSKAVVGFKRLLTINVERN